jgi:hypothetical protein
VSPGAVLVLVREIAEAVEGGLAASGIEPFAKQRHPELRLDPFPPLDDAARARAEAHARVRELDELDTPGVDLGRGRIGSERACAGSIPSACSSRSARSWRSSGG